MTTLFVNLGAAKNGQMMDKVEAVNENTDNFKIKAP